MTHKKEETPTQEVIHDRVSWKGSALQYFDNGYLVTPIRHAQKAPLLPSWQEKILKEGDIIKGEHRWADAGVGVICGRYVAEDADGQPLFLQAFDLDIVDQALSTKVADLVIKALSKDAAPLIRVGLSPKCLLPFLSPEHSRKRKLGFGNEQAVELLADGQQFVAEGVHPITGKPYEWLKGRSPLKIPIEDLPLLSADAQAVLWVALEKLVPLEEIAVGAMRGRRRVSGKSGDTRILPPAVGATDSHSNMIRASYSGEPLTQAEVRQIVEAVPGRDANDYDKWIELGMRLKHWSEWDSKGDSSYAFALWCEWSNKATRPFDGAKGVSEDELRRQKWASFESELYGVSLPGLLPFLEQQGLRLQRDAPGYTKIETVEDLIRRWVFYVPENMMLDTYDTVSPRESMSKIAGFKNRYHQKIRIEGQDKFVKKADVVLTDPRLQAVDAITYVPCEKKIWVDKRGRRYYNLWTDRGIQLEALLQEDPSTDGGHGYSVFCRHVQGLLPHGNDAETFLDWIAFKLQNPDKRAYAVLMIADGVFGTGRSQLMAYCSKMTGDAINIAFSELLGEGTFNGWMCERQLVTVDESKEVSATGNNWTNMTHGYERLKTIVDPGVVTGAKINPKYGRQFSANLYFNLLIASNHSVPFYLPEGDRRFWVARNTDTKMSEKHYSEMQSCIDDNVSIISCRRHLLVRDVSKFNNHRPPMSDLKMSVVEASRNPWKVDVAEMLSAKEDVVTVSRRELKRRMSVVLNGRDELNPMEIDARLGRLVRNLWAGLAKAATEPGEPEQRVLRRSVAH